jgi:hypothetical protein
LTERKRESECDRASESKTESEREEREQPFSERERERVRVRESWIRQAAAGWPAQRPAAARRRPAAPRCAAG